MKVYLSGKITGLEKTVYTASFLEAHDEIRELYPDKPFLEIACPLDMSAWVERRIAEPTWHDYMRHCVRVLATCDSIYLLTNWRESDGAKVEHQLALDLGLKIHYKK